MVDSVCCLVMIKKTLLPLVLLLVLFCNGTEGSPFAHWAARGVVVNKTFRPTPLSGTLGVDGIYKLELRDEKNKVRRQMVTRDVYLAYEVGDEFDANAAPPTVAQRAVRVAFEQAKENLEAPPAEEQPAEMTVSISETENRLAVASFPQEMVPETEGF